MHTRVALLTSVALISAGIIVLAQAQQPPPAPPQAPQSPGMTFFIAGSNPGGKGGDLGGLEGADRLKGVVLAEVELQQANQKLDLPSWVGEEVTGDPRYRKISMLTQRIVDLRESQTAAQITMS